jgi:hypothetical protein
MGSQNWVEKCPDSAHLWEEILMQKQSGASTRVFQT